MITGMQQGGKKKVTGCQTLTSCYDSPSRSNRVTGFFLLPVHMKNKINIQGKYKKRRYLVTFNGLYGEKSRNRMTPCNIQTSCYFANNILVIVSPHLYIHNNREVFLI